MEDLDARLPDAVEEFVRWASPVMTFRRTTTREVELHGQKLPAGEKVVLFYHSGNRDERAFERPVAASTSPATRTATSGSAAAARTTAWAPRWPAPSCARSSARCCA